MGAENPGPTPIWGMQASKSYVRQKGVRIIYARIYVGGSDEGMHQVEISSAMSGDLPGRLAITSGFNQSTGTITWQMTDATPNLWTGFSGGLRVPKIGERIEIDMSLSPSDIPGPNKWVRVFTGRVDFNEVQDGNQLVTHIVDDWDKFGKGVEVMPLLRHMPGRKNSDFKKFTPGCSINWVVWDVLDQCGFAVSPASKVPLGVDKRVVMHAPLQGTMWTAWERYKGACVKAGPTEESYDFFPTFVYHDSGECYLFKGWGVYENLAENRNLRGTQPVMVRFRVGAGHTGKFTLKLTVGGKKVAITLEGNKRLSVHPGQNPRYGDFLVPKDGVVEFLMHVNGRWETRLGVEGTPGPSGVHERWWGPNSEVGNCEIIAELGCEISDVLVAMEPLPLSGRKQAHVRIPDYLNNPYWVPSVRGRKASEFLEELGELIHCAMWLDSTGEFHFKHGTMLREATEKGVISADDVVDYTLRQDILRSGSAVRVKSKITWISNMGDIGKIHRATLWQGTGQSILGNEVVEEFIGPDENEDWFELDDDIMWNLHNFFNTPISQHGNGWKREIEKIYYGSCYFAIGQNGYTGYVAAPKLERLAWWRWKLTIDNKSVFGGSGESTRSTMQFPVNNRTMPGTYEDMWGEKMPIIRGGAKAKAKDDGDAVVLGPLREAPELEIDAGIWAGSRERGLELAKDVAAWLTDSKAVYSDSINVIFDPGYRVGDVYRWEVPGITTRVYCLVLGVEHRPGEDRTELTVRTYMQLE